MRLIDFQPDHLISIKARPFLQPNPDQDILQTSSMLMQMGPAYTLVDENQKALASGGIAIMWPGVGAAWLYLGDQGRSRELKLKIAKLCRQQIKEIFVEYRLHRVQAEVHSKFYIAQRFIEWLGFKSEGMAKSFGTDQSDWIHYARTTTK